MTLTFFCEGSELAGGRYVLERRLGSGGMATVWEALDASLQRRVAIKLPSDALTSDPTFARRFEREARTAAAVSHPNLVPVFDYGTEGERPYLVSELIDGASLDLLRDRRESPPSEDLARALLAALGHIHAAGIVHRDVKPGNVIVDGERILLTDFGIAQPAEATSLTSTGMVIGTKRYLAPEVRRGKRAGPAADLYACGVVVSEQLLDHDPDRLHRLVAELTADAPEDRPESAERALAQLEPGEAATATVPIAVPAPPPPPAPEDPPDAPAAELGPERVLAGRSFPTVPGRVPARSRSSRPIALGLLAAAIAGVALVIALSGGDEEPAGGKQSAQGQATAGDAETSTTTATETQTTTAQAPAPAPADEEPAPSGDGEALNAQGKALLDAGNPEDAVPILEQAVAAYPSDSTDINYAYALFNYGQALRLSGDPEAAIPVLEKRLTFDDQAETVQRELDLAEQEAGK